MMLPPTINYWSVSKRCSFKLKRLNLQPINIIKYIHKCILFYTMKSSSNDLIRKIVLQGGWCLASIDREAWQIPSSNLLVFVSSTFTDTHGERNILIEKLLPILQLKARRDEISVTFVDMRYGVRDENTLDHKTWYFCAKELERCRKESAGLFFLSLQGDKYGYRPLPKVINQELFEKSAINWTQEQLKLGLRWYRLDENAEPPEYVLRNLSQLHDDEFWTLILPALRTLLSGIPFDTERTADIRIGQSVTDWETKYALSLSSSANKCVWLHRQFQGEYDNMMDLKHEISDIYDNESRTNLQLLKEYMYTKLCSDKEVNYKSTDLSEKQVSEYEIPTYMSIGDISISSYIEKDDMYENYMHRWEELVRNIIDKELSLLTSRLSAWKHDGCGLGIAGEALSEILHHCQWAATKFSIFCKRQSLITTGLEMLLMNSPKKADDHDEDGLRGISLAVVGVSGSGKTSLMAKLAAEIYEREQNASKPPRPVVIRFCGTSPGSNDGLALVHSLIAQISFLYRPKVSQNVAGTYPEAVAQLHELLSAYPVILFIDSLDQLSNYYLERSRISFLQGAKPHADSLIIVSTLPDELDRQSKQWKYCYQCESRLKENGIPILTVSALNIETEAPILMQEMLRTQFKRTCTPRQWSYIMQQTMVEPTVLYCQLACRVISTWASWESGCELAEGVHPLIAQILGNVEREYGVLLTRCALGFITYSVEGINDEEIQDLLSLHDGVVDSVFQYSSLSHRRVPFHVWARLRSAMTGMLVEKQGGCLKWYHRQLQEAAEQRYKPEKLELQRIMGLYFGNYIPENVRRNRLIKEQPLLFTKVPVWLSFARINRRRCAEAGLHLVQGNLLEEATALLCKIEEICACVKSGFAIEVLRNLIFIENRLKDRKTSVHFELYETLTHYVRWLRTHLSMINENPTMNMPLTAFRQPALSHAFQDMQGTLQHLQRTTMVPFGLSRELQATTFDNTWIVARRLGNLRKFGRKISSISTYAEMVSKVEFSPDGSKLVTALSDKRVSIWDCASGLELVAFMGHLRSVTSVAYSHDGRLVASGSVDQTVRVWDVATASEICCFRGHANVVSSVAFSLNDRYIFSASYDSSICIWDTHDPSKICDASEAHSRHAGLVYTIFPAHDGAFICAIGISPDGKYLASRGLDFQLKIWNLEKDYSLETTLYGLGFMASNVVFSPNGRIVASGGDENAILLWETATWQPLTTLTGHTENVYSIAFSPDSRYLVAGDQGRLVKLWAIDSAKEILSLEGHNLAVNSVAFSPDGALIASASSDSTIGIWDATIPDMRDTLEITAGTADAVSSSSTAGEPSPAVEQDVDVQGHTRIVQTLALRSLEGDTSDRLVSGSYDKRVKLWDGHSGEEIATISGHNRWVYSVCFTPDGREVVSGADDGKIIVSNADTGEEVCILAEVDADPKKGVMTVAVSPCGQYIVSGANDGRVRLWCRARRTLLWVADTCRSSSFSSFSSVSDVASVANTVCPSHSNNNGNNNDNNNDNDNSNNDNKADVTHQEEEKAAVTHHQEEEMTRDQPQRERVSASVFTPDGRYLAVGTFGSGAIHVWTMAHILDCVAKTQQRDTPLLEEDVDNETHFWRGFHRREIMSLAASVCGRYLVSASRDTTAAIWDVSSGTRTQQLLGHRLFVTGALFTPDVSRVVSISVDKTIKVWCVATGQVLVSLVAHHQSGYALALSPDGQRLYVGYGDGTIVALRFYRWNEREDSNSKNNVLRDQDKEEEEEMVGLNDHVEKEDGWNDREDERSDGVQTTSSSSACRG